MPTPLSKEVRQIAKSLLDYRNAGTVLEDAFVEALNTAACANSAKDLAKLWGMSPQYLSDLRRGRRAVSDGVLRKIIGAKNAH